VYTGFWWGNLRAIDRLEEPGVNWKIILRRIFRKWDVGHGHLQLNFSLIATPTPKP